LTNFKWICHQRAFVRVKKCLDQAWQYMPVIPAIKEMESRRTEAQGQAKS
jgi:hypothetical protein